MSTSTSSALPTKPPMLEEKESTLLLYSNLLDRYKSLLPLRILFAQSCQVAKDPSHQQTLDEITGVVVNVELSLRKNQYPQFVWSVLYKDPLQVKKVSKGVYTIQTIPKDERSYTLFHHHIFCTTCYYHWDVNGTYSNQQYYRRDITSLLVEKSPNHFVRFNNLLLPKKDLSHPAKIKDYLKNKELPSPSPELCRWVKNLTYLTPTMNGRSTLKGKGTHDPYRGPKRRKRKLPCDSVIEPQTSSSSSSSSSLPCESSSLKKIKNNSYQ